MAKLELTVTVISARNLKKATLIGPMQVYTIVSLSGVPKSSFPKNKTPIHRGHDTNPYWNSSTTFTVDPKDFEGLTVVFDIKHKRTFYRDKILGQVNVPVNDVLCKKGQLNGDSFSYPVQTRSGESNGYLEFSVKVSGLDWPVPPPLPLVAVEGVSRSEEDSQTPKVSWVFAYRHHECRRSQLGRTQSW